MIAMHGVFPSLSVLRGRCTILAAVAECVYCGAKTQRYVNDQPVCLHCAKNHKPQRSSQPGLCQEYSKLLKAYQQSMVLFSLTVGALEAARATVPRDESRRNAGYFEQARMMSDQARAELEKHVTEHGCCPALSAGDVYYSQL